MTQALDPSLLTQDCLTRILDSLQDALLVLDPGGVVQLCTPESSRLLGLAEGELLERPLPELLASGQELPELGDENFPLETQLRHSSGTLIPVMLTLSTIEAIPGRQRFVCQIRDIRERRRSEQALREYAEKLARSNRELTDFAYVASHDLQEPLRKVTAFGERLEAKCGEALGDQGRGYLDRMQNAAGRMQVLINDLLSYSRVVTKAKPFSPVALGKVAEEVLEDLEVRIAELGGRVEVAELPVIDADPLQMRQLFQNLIGNALKFHRSEEPPLVRIQSENGEESDSPFCRISIADNGIGFEPEYGERIFEVFQRLHGRSQYEGSGIGLAICRKIAQRHGGDLKGQGMPGQGATFTLTLPLRQAVEKTMSVTELTN